MNKNYRDKHAPLTVAQELLLIGQGSELGMAFVNEFMPLGPAAYPKIDQQACLNRIKEKLRYKDRYFVDGDGVPRVKPDFESEEKSRSALFGPSGENGGNNGGV